MKAEAKMKKEICFSRDDGKLFLLSLFSAILIYFSPIQNWYLNPLLLILDEWMLLKPADTEQKDIFLNFFIRDARNHQPSSVLSMYLKNGMISLVVKQVL